MQQNKLSVEQFLEKFPCFAVQEGWELVDAPGVKEASKGGYLIKHDNDSAEYVCVKFFGARWDNTFLLRHAYELIDSPYDYQVGDELEDGRKVVAVTKLDGHSDIVTCTSPSGSICSCFYNNKDQLESAFFITRRNGRPVKVKVV